MSHRQLALLVCFTSLATARPARGDDVEGPKSRANGSAATPSTPPFPAASTSPTPEPAPSALVRSRYRLEASLMGGLAVRTAAYNGTSPAGGAFGLAVTGRLPYVALGAELNVVSFTAAGESGDAGSNLVAIAFAAEARPLNNRLVDFGVGASVGYARLTSGCEIDCADGLSFGPTSSLLFRIAGKTSDFDVLIGPRVAWSGLWAQRAQTDVPRLVYEVGFFRGVVEVAGSWGL